jgi:4-amino-4-deoxy-L-arabinose transferase-like glycosyltransferase
LSMKIFGVSAVAARIPSLLLSTLMILLIYALGKRWKDEVTGFLGALLYTTGHYMLELVAGRYHTDHNDVAFVFFITASLWAYTEYHIEGRKTMILWIGVFAAMAVLNKWLTGLLVYLFWGVALLSNKLQRKQLKSYLNLLYALGITLLLSLPWQLYTHIRFPLEAAWEAQYNSLHFFEVIEGHGGDFWYHFQQIPVLYGKYTAWFILVGSVLFWSLIRDKAIRNAGIATIVFVYLFFTLASTKMPAFTLLLAAPAYLSMGYLLKLAHSFFRMSFRKTFFPNALITILSVVLTIHLFNHGKVLQNHSIHKNSYVLIRSTDNHIFQQLPLMLPPGEFVLFNCRSQEDVQIMFETPYIAYQGLPSQENIETIRDKGYRIGVFDDKKLPERITADTSIFIIVSAMWY